MDHLDTEAIASYNGSIQRKEAAGRRMQSIDIDIQWGGYYVSQREETGQFGVFRLLDFNQYAYQAALFREEFASVPSLEEILSLSPFIGHVPMAARGLVRPSIQLVGSVPLTPADLEGYRIYLEHHGVSLQEQDELETRIIGFSHEAPLPLRLEIVGDELRISERV